MTTKPPKFRCMWCQAITPRAKAKTALGCAVCSDNCARALRRDPQFRAWAKETGNLKV